MQGPCGDVILADLHCQAPGAVGSLDLAEMIDDVEALVAGLDIFPRPRVGAAGPTQAADQGLAHRVVVRFDAFYLHLPIKPGDRVNPYPPVYGSGADAVAAPAALPFDPRLE